MFCRTIFTIIMTAVSGSALAAPVANMKINGNVMPPTCSINGAEQGELVADFGSISPSLLKANSNSIPRVIIPLTVSCDAKTYLTLLSVDTYGHVDADQATSSKSISVLVDDSDRSRSVGQSYFSMKDLKVDGDTAYYGRETASTGTSTGVFPNKIAAWTTEQQLDVSPSKFKLASGKVFTANLEIGGYLFGASQLAAKGIDLTKEVNYIGENVLTFNFGI